MPAPWTTAQVNRLRVLRGQQGLSEEEIAIHMEKTVWSIRSKIRKLGITLPPHVRSERHSVAQRARFIRETIDRTPGGFFAVREKELA